MCTTGCVTKDHDSWGSCMRAKNLKVAYCQSADGKDATAQKQWDKELDLYYSASAQGVRAAGTKTAQVREALDISDMTGKAFDASAGLKPIGG